MSDPIHEAQERGSDFLDAMKREAFTAGERAMAEARRLDEQTLTTPLHARIAELEQALAAHGKHDATCPLSIGMPPCDCELNSARSGRSSWLAEHDAKVRAKERDACYFADPGKPPTERADYCAGWYAALDHKCATIRALGDASKEKRGEWDRLHARIAQLEKAAQDVAGAYGPEAWREGVEGLAASARLALAVGHLRDALSGTSLWLAEHDAQTRADEREVCAKVCDEMASHTIWTNWRSAYIDAAAAIRAHSEEEMRDA